MKITWIHICKEKHVTSLEVYPGRLQRHGHLILRRGPDDAVERRLAGAAQARPVAGAEDVAVALVERDAAAGGGALKPAGEDARGEPEARPPGPPASAPTAPWRRHGTTAGPARAGSSTATAPS